MMNINRNYKSLQIKNNIQRLLMNKISKIILSWEGGCVCVHNLQKLARSVEAPTENTQNEKRKIANW